MKIKAVKKLYEIAPKRAAEPMVELLTAGNLEEGDFQFLTESLRSLYAKSDSQILKKMIERKQGHYDTTAHSDDMDYDQTHWDFDSGYTNTFTLDENV